MSFTEQVAKYIKIGSTDDLDDMSSLAFEITVEMNNHFEDWKVTAYNQDLARIA